jgi:hypothetical protein
MAVGRSLIANTSGRKNRPPGSFNEKTYVAACD